MCLIIESKHNKYYKHEKLSAMGLISSLVEFSIALDCRPNLLCPANDVETFIVLFTASEELEGKRTSFQELRSRTDNCT